MMRLIDAESTKKLAQEHLIDPYHIVSACAVIDKAETVDAVPVVRCRECKHLNVVNDEKLYAHCPKTNTVFLPFQLDTRIHFCSLGERR